MHYWNGYTLSLFQGCKRPEAISKTHRLAQWRPQSLLGACLRAGIFDLSNGGDLDKVQRTAVQDFLNSAKNPGLDIRGIDTYTYAQDYCAIIRNVLEYLSRQTLLSLQDMPPMKLTSDVSWQFLSHKDESGTLHRWQFVDYLDEDLTPELHSWEVFGDIAAADMPMELHIVAIGKRQGSHQASPWCRIYSHPKLAKVYKFQKVKGDRLQGEWKPVYFAANSDNNPKDWVDTMFRDNVFPGIIRHVHIKEVSKEHRELFRRDVFTETEILRMMKVMRKLDDPKQLPMGRYRCDNPFPCPHQNYCYTNATLDGAGIYERKTKDERNT